jgi:5'-methylthioadenosine phosphorylase
MSAKIGIIGGSGFYSMLEDPQFMAVESDYGETSDDIAVGTINGKEVAFIPRHAAEHTITPQNVPYRANIDVMSKLGVKRIIATNAVGSLKAEYAPGDFVIFDQFVNMTSCRNDTFYDKQVVAHVSTADPYCSELRSIASSEAKTLGINVHDAGTVVVVGGPRFSTRAESRFFRAQGFDVINMTQYPEAALAREKGICYVGIGIVTDYDAGLEGDSGIKPVSADIINEVFAKSIEKMHKLVMRIIEATPDTASCSCSTALDGAIMTKHIR